MSITDKEKEELFEEFALKLRKAKQGYASGYETYHNMEPAKNYFKKRYDSMTKEFEFDIWSRKGIVWADWDMIRKLVCHVYGVCIVKQIPVEKIEEANNLAKTFIDLIFDKNLETLKG